MNPATTTTTTITGNPNPSAVGQQVTFTAIVTAVAGTPTGSVAFFNGATLLGTATLNGSGQATLAVSTMAMGTQTITASYSGASGFAASSGAINQVVNAATTEATTTTVSSTPNPSTPGQAVTITATVTSTAGIPTGTVLFFSGATVLGSASLNNAGTASISLTTLPVGTNTIQANYSGSAIFNSSSGSTTQTVTSAIAAATTTTVFGSPNPSTVGQSVTFTASVSSASGIPTGTVEFLDGATDLGIVTLNGSGLASISTSALPAGTNTIEANYGGAAGFGSSFGTTTQVVNAAVAATTTTVSSTPNPSSLGQAVTITATVTSGAGTPTGTVLFLSGATVLGSASLNNFGTASISVLTLPVGGNTIVASFGGATGFSSSSGTTTQFVNASVAQTTTTVTATPNPAGLGQLVTLTASVFSTSSTPTTGAVDFRDGGVDLGSTSLNGAGQASLSLSTFTVGTHSITATYSGTANFGASTGSTTLTVNQETTTTTITSLTANPNPAAVGQVVTLTATVTSTAGVPSGTVTFLFGTTNLGTAALNGLGKATLNFVTLTPGTQTITAFYEGTPSFTGSSGAVTEVTNSVGPALTPNEIWVSQVYRNILGRNGELSGIQYWAQESPPVPAARPSRSISSRRPKAGPSRSITFIWRRCTATPIRRA